ncbi:MAG TPA: 23S rRNA (adenine(2503)-C(2))-methyltransferase RlmN [Phycisphaerales bacterium]|nr:23S rRNA (adenine(2503)-C(2))-methyltransferase RlmN [Phycisphaerales bacterium]
MRHPANHIFHHTPDTLRAWFAARGLPPYRADQTLDWVYRKGVADPAAMTNLARPDRERLTADMTFLSGDVVRRQTATDGTEKLLVEWTDFSTVQTEHEAQASANPPTTSVVRSSRIPLPLHAPPPSARQTECVMIPVEASRGSNSAARRTACISSQVGCPVGCRFCASGLGGLDGNLSAGRIVEQVWRLNSLLSSPSTSPTSSLRHSVTPPLRITHVVFMGMGEPLANLPSVIHAVRTLAAPWGVGLSARRITISTVGLPRAIEKLAEQLDLPVTLALSLHAPNDDLRRRLIPWAEYTSIADLLAACRVWFEKTGREITLEYILLGGVNDRPEHAAQLAGVARSLRANVNLIRYNEVEGLEFRRPRTDDVRDFQRILRARGVNTHIRRSRGRDIAAACGQLRHEAAT